MWGTLLGVGAGLVFSGGMLWFGIKGRTGRGEAAERHANLFTSLMVGGGIGLMVCVGTLLVLVNNRQMAASSTRDRDEVLAGLSSSSVKTRRWAAKAAGNRKYTEALEPLLVLLEDPDARVRVMAVWSIGQLGKAGGPHAPRIARVTEDTDQYVRGWARQALKSLGDHAIPSLTAALNDTEREGRRWAARGLLYVLEPGHAALESAAVDPNVAVRRTVVFALGAWATEKEFAAPILERALADADGEVRWTAAWGLANRPGESWEGKPVFMRAVAKSVPDCLAAARGQDLGKRARAIRVLTLPAAAVNPDDIAPVLADALRHNETAGEAANAEWKRFGAAGAKALLPLLQEPENRDAATHALLAIGWDALDVLRVYIRDESVPADARDHGLKIMEHIEENDDPDDEGR